MIEEIDPIFLEALLGEPPKPDHQYKLGMSLDNTCVYVYDNTGDLLYVKELI